MTGNRAAVWKSLGQFIAAPRNPEFDKLRGLENPVCSCGHQHEAGVNECHWSTWYKRTKNNQEERPRRGNWRVNVTQDIVRIKCGCIRGQD